MARERVLALDEHGALADALGLGAKHGIGLFDESVSRRAEKVKT